MKLTLGAHGEREVADEAGLRQALALLDGEEDSFAILEREDGSFIQTSGGGSDGFIAERRLKDATRLDHAMRADSEGLQSASQDHGTFDREETTQMFLAFLFDRPQPIFASWKNIGVEVGGTGGCLALLALIAMPSVILMSILPA